MRHLVERQGKQQDDERDEDLREVDVQGCLTLTAEPAGKPVPRARRALR